MLVSMKVNCTEHNSNSDFHGSREELTIREENGETLSTIKTFADTTHDWWKDWADEGTEVLVDVKDEDQKGVWYTMSGNFHIDISSSSNLVMVESYPNVNVSGESIDDKSAFAHYDTLRKCYMVCDNVEQALEYWKGAVQNDEFKYIISLTPVRKKVQPEEGGWRWHKWGDYIGTQNPQHEYLYDEPEIEIVFCAHIYQVEEI